MLLRELRPHRKHAPTVDLVTTPDGEFVRKSYLGCSFWIRELVGRLALQRECWALSRLRGSGHAPELIERPDRSTILTEYIAGTPLEKLDRQKIDVEKLREQAASLLSTLEKAGIAHGDIGHDHWQEMGRESNLIWTPDERLVAIDFAGAVPLGPGLLRHLGEALHQHDRLLTAKIAHHFHPGDPVRAPGVDWPLELWDLLRLLGKI